MSEEKLPELPSAPKPPGEKKRGDGGCLSGRGCGCLVAIGLCFAVFLLLMLSSGGEALLGVVLYAITIVAIFVEYPVVALIPVVVIGAVYFGRKLHNRQEIGDEPSIAPQPLPRTQAENSSNQEAEPSELTSSPQQSKKEEGLSIRGILLILGVMGGLASLAGLYVMYIVNNIP